MTTRFAPSPTGYLHIGGLRTALYNYLWAKKNNGEFKLRIEDTDKSRNSEDAVKAILESFSWVGMNSDCEIQYQSKRTEIYTKYIDILLSEGKAYKCYMSKDELQDIKQKQMDDKQTPKYNGTWRPEAGKTLPEIPENINPTIRIKAPQNEEINFVDGVKGDMKFDANQVDDFIIAREDGTPTYNFVVAIDDALMGIDEVLRGDDHLSNTPKQIVVYNLLGFKIPKFYHIPMINNSQGKKLSKRDGAMNVMDYKDQGVLPEALLNFLVRLGWSNGDDEIFSMNELINLFDPSNINKSSSSYNHEKLLWLNAHYIKNSTALELDILLKDLGLDIKSSSALSSQKIDDMLEVYKSRAKTLLELKDAVITLIEQPKQYNAKGVKKFIKSDTTEILNSFVVLLNDNKDICTNSDKIKELIEPYIKENELKFPQIFQPIRLSITGDTNAPAVYDLIDIIGVDETISRINKALEINFNKKED